MKILIAIALLIGMNSTAQIKGNGNVISKTINIQEVTFFELNMYAEVIIDASAPSQLEITAESNLIEYIDMEVVNGKLNLEQLQWISPTQPIQINIGSQNLKNVQVGAHRTVKVINIDQDYIALTALVGKIEVQGKARDVNLNAEQGTVDAGALETQTAQLNIWGRGNAIINAQDRVSGKISEEAKLKFIKMPDQLDRNIEKAIEKKDQNEFADAQYIRFKIKNNSLNRHHFAVKGPKSDGSYFGYGFPMMPQAVRKENWTVGTKIYKVNKLGLRKLIKEIKASDEGTTVKLFD